jgi:hypothetical protein
VGKGLAVKGSVISMIVYALIRTVCIQDDTKYPVVMIGGCRFV